MDEIVKIEADVKMNGIKDGCVVECGSRAGGVRLASLTFSPVSASAETSFFPLQYYPLSKMLDVLIVMLIN